MTRREALRHLGEALARAVIGVCTVCALILAHEPGGPWSDTPRVATITIR